MKKINKHNNVICSVEIPFLVDMLKNKSDFVCEVFVRKYASKHESVYPVRESSLISR